jgi:hypothetical protein
VHLIKGYEGLVLCGITHTPTHYWWGNQVTESGRLLLIVSCSQRKRPDPGLLPALDRYDGGHFRILRKARRERYWPETMDMLILSAKYGLVAGSTPITNYDQKITRDRAKELHSQVLQVLQTCTRQHTYREVYVDLGQAYQAAVEGLAQVFNGSLIVYAKGRIGQRLAQLQSWLVAQYREGSMSRSRSEG